MLKSSLFICALFKGNSKKAVRGKYIFKNLYDFLPRRVFKERGTVKEKVEMDNWISGGTQSSRSLRIFPEAFLLFLAQGGDSK